MKWLLMGEGTGGNFIASIYIAARRDYLSAQLSVKQANRQTERKIPWTHG